MPLLLESHPDFSGRGKHSLLWGPVALSVLPFWPKQSLTEHTLALIPQTLPGPYSKKMPSWALP